MIIVDKNNTQIILKEPDIIYKGDNKIYKTDVITKWKISIHGYDLDYDNERERDKHFDIIKEQIIKGANIIDLSKE